MAVSDIIVSIGGDTKQLRSELRKSSAQLRKFGNESVKKYGAYATAATAAGVAVTAAFVSKGLDAVDAQAKLAKQIGSTTSEVATLTRAGELAGVGLAQITAASLKLSVNAGKAEQGLMAQKRSFDAMGISAKEVLALPLSERFTAINNAINQNVAASERAAVASDVFGQKNASLIALLDSGTIGRAAHEAEVFGLNLSEIDAASVENANDSISTMKKGMEGLSNQLAVQFAPIIQRIGDEFFNASEEAGGLGNTADKVFNGMVTAVGFVLDAIHGIKVLFKVVADGLIIGMTHITSNWGRAIQKLFEAADNVPFTDFSEQIASVKNFADTQESIMKSSMENVNETLNARRPSEGLKQFVKDAQEASEAAAKAAVDARGKGVVGGDSGESSNVSDFKTAKLEALRKQYATEQELLLEKLEAEREILDEARANGAIKDQEWNDLQLAAKQSYEDSLTELEKKASDDRARIAEQEARNRQEVMSGMMANLSSLMNAGSKKMFEIGKKASLASAIISGIEAATSSYAAGAKVGGPVLGAAFAATSIASTGAKISAIRAQSFGGGGSQAGQAGAAASGGATAQTIPQQQQQQQNLYVRGINPSQMFSGQQLVDIINNAQDQGAVLRVGT